MDVKYPNLPDAENRIVYVRPVAVSALPAELRTQVGELATVYSVHGENGEQLALVANRELAFALARQHDFSPVNVH